MSLLSTSPESDEDSILSASDEDSILAASDDDEMEGGNGGSDSEEEDISVDDEIEDITGPIDRSPPIKVDKIEDLPDPTTVPNLYAWVGKDKYEKNRKGHKWVKVEEEDLYD